MDEDVMAACVAEEAVGKDLIRLANWQAFKKSLGLRKLVAKELAECVQASTLSTSPA
eukprot:m.37130 g.37130  ORF g.37130 m.37130 type:complete len:57 (-) comp12478_c0_seq3:58-228(-)